jgi:CHASE2 domain-containing sensor protein
MVFLNYAPNNSIMKKFFLDTVFAFLFVLGVIGFFNSITYFRIFEVFDPIGEMFADFEITDIVMSQIREIPPADEGIVLVNVGDINRVGIAEQIRVINQYNPKVIGLDLLLNEPHDDLEDSIFLETIKSVENLVIGQKLLYNPTTDEFDYSIGPNERFKGVGELAFVNLITGAKHQDDLKVCRSFPPQEKLRGRKQLAFSVKLASYVSKEKVDKFLARGNNVEYINYKGNILDFGATEFGTRYYALDVMDVIAENFEPEIIKDKIVIFCYLGDYLGDRQTIEDKFITPLNSKYVGKTGQDMFGGVIHANIVSMVLQEDYIDSMPDGWAIFWALLIGYLTVVLFAVIYKALPNWYDGITKVFQLMLVLLLASLMVYIFHISNYKINISYLIIIILLSGDALEVYFGVVKNLFTKAGRKSLIKVKKVFY